jgi:hypothetical protein
MRLTAKVAYITKRAFVILRALPECEKVALGLRANADAAIIVWVVAFLTGRTLRVGGTKVVVLSAKQIGAINAGAAVVVGVVAFLAGRALRVGGAKVVGLESRRGKADDGESSENDDRGLHDDCDDEWRCDWCGVGYWWQIGK